MTYFRKEIDSSGKLISAVTNTALMIVLTYQVCMMAFFVIKNRPIEACTIVLVMVISVFYMVISYEEVYDLNKINDDEEPVAKRVKPSDDALNRWK